MIDITKATAGALLHDIGKVVQRAGGVSGTHSEIGAEYMKKMGFTDKDILDCISYHHAREIRSAAAPVSPYAYIAYIADNIASQERRSTSEENPEKGWDSKAPLQSVFNLLHGESEPHFYRPVTLDEREKINYPQKESPTFKDYFYSRIVERLTENLDKFEFKQSYVNSLLELAEALLSFVPSSTNKGEVADLSLYDHMKLTAAAAGCIALYISKDEKDDEQDYKKLLFTEADKFYSQKFAILYSADISGIQKFIYTIHSEKALKSLRSRSFYLELFMENLIDEILSNIGLTRANLLYCGGGHLYMLLPNTEDVITKLSDIIKKTNNWLLERFRADLYIADGFCACSAYDLQNKPTDSYKRLFIEAARMISNKKMNRYSGAEISRLNNTHTIGTECKICKAIGDNNDDNVCGLCASLINMSGQISHQYDKAGEENKDKKETFFIISSNKNGVPVAENQYVSAVKSDLLLRELKKDNGEIIRYYGKNTFHMGENLSTRLWVGDYCKEKELSAYAEKSGGVERLGVLRMDVDNLGNAFTQGFDFDEGNFNTLSRTATLSRHLSMFFKRGINMLLKDSEREVTIIYSGGDDMFLIGAWDDIIDTAIEVNNAFKRYSQGRLTISAGIGLYPGKYPVHVMARETGDLESCAKDTGKNAAALFAPELCFGWDALENQVIGEKLKLLEEYFGNNTEKGNSFLYKILAHIQGVETEEKDGKAKISLARYAYLLARAEPDSDDESKKKGFRQFSEHMYGWLQTASDRKQLKAAICLYVYSKRGVQKND
ncbi:MAG: type III-A CRISPR-associated protein Cas10/Csm1 [Oscillospiraceae bacterium]|nr:type III-A CRISPR-associated protein Cas10/Csm1 [Oscillospiraceae bacterium]